MFLAQQVSKDRWNANIENVGLEKRKTQIEYFLG